MSGPIDTRCSNQQSSGILYGMQPIYTVQPPSEYILYSEYV